MSLCVFVSGTVRAKSAKQKKPENKKTVLELSKAEMCLYVGQVRKLDYSLSGDKKNKKNKARVQWKSSDKKVVTVNKKGEIKGKKTGKAKITAWIKGNAGTKAVCKVKVKEFKEMSYSVPFKEVKYIDTGKLMELKGDLINSGYFKVIESRKELKEFIKKYNLEKAIKDKGYSFTDINFSDSNLLVYVRDIQLVKRIHTIDYSLVKNGSDVEMRIDIDYWEDERVSYPCIINCCLLFEIMPKKFVECVDKLVYNNIYNRLNILPESSNTL